jgi:hypothetical protein
MVMDPRTRLLLEAPIAPTLLRLAAVARGAWFDADRGASHEKSLTGQGVEAGGTASTRRTPIR